jgi:asparagine synthase (glutamine-hydrolysing)
MCGIAGFYKQNKSTVQNIVILERMISILDHRGPDDRGYHIGDSIGFAHSRLSIIDLEGGKQPIYNEDKSICVIFNGEIFNYLELREYLLKKGHKFYTKSDTEVIVHCYEEFGYDFLNHLNGQFAIALWNERTRELLLARDRIGIRPIFYSKLQDDSLIFASEMKALFCYPGVKAEIDPAGINQIFTLWVNIPPRTVFKNIYELPPGHFLTISQKGIKFQKYWKLQFPYANEYEEKSLKYYKNKLQELLHDAVTIRLRADVPVAAYLSGGIDSSIISALIKKYHNNNLITFSVAFSDGAYDEKEFQRQMVNHLKTDHRSIMANYENISNSFSDVVWFSEKPMIRTAPAPLYLLSGLVRKNNIKVILTGEGADEVFGGYDIFKEDKIRRFWAKYPNSKIRPGLLSSIYHYINNSENPAQNFWQLFFKKNLTDTNNPFYSHLIRWTNTAQIKKFFTDDYRMAFDDSSQIYSELDQYVDPEIIKWHPFCRAQYLEMQLFLSGYLLSSQGDRMMMGHSVEGRFPFLDYRVIEFANSIPPNLKMNVLNEKYILKETFKQLLPESIVHRKKQPYRAPIYQCFNRKINSLAAKMFDPKLLIEYGYFDASLVGRMIKKLEETKAEQISARQDMAMVGIASLQLLHTHFLTNFNFNRQLEQDALIYHKQAN